MRGVAHTMYGGKVGETMGLVFYCRQTFGLECITPPDSPDLIRSRMNWG